MYQFAIKLLFIIYIYICIQTRELWANTCETKWFIIITTMFGIQTKYIFTQVLVRD